MSQHQSFIADVEAEYENDFDVVSRVKIVTSLFKNEDYSTLESEYNDHELTDKLFEYRSLHLFPGTSRDVVIVYKSHRAGDHIVFHRIGTHEKVYHPGYGNLDRNRRMKNR